MIYQNLMFIMMQPEKHVFYAPISAYLSKMNGLVVLFVSSPRCPAYYSDVIFGDNDPDKPLVLQMWNEGLIVLTAGAFLQTLCSGLIACHC